MTHSMHRRRPKPIGRRRLRPAMRLWLIHGLQLGERVAPGSGLLKGRPVTVMTRE